MYDDDTIPASIKIGFNFGRSLLLETRGVRHCNICFSCYEGISQYLVCMFYYVKQNII